jgi:hypothetical protein
MVIVLVPEGKLSLNRPLFMVAVNERYLNVSFLAALIINQWSRKVSKSKQTEILVFIAYYIHQAVRKTSGLVFATK